MDTPAIRSKILRSGQVDWRRFSFLQPDSFKALSKTAYEKLRASILENGFVESFKVWESGKKLYCLDGYHRCRVLADLEAEGRAVPETFHADFLECTSKKDAAKLVLIYSSIYADITDEGLYEFAETLGVDLAAVAAEIDLPSLDIDKFLKGWGKDDGDGDGEKAEGTASFNYESQFGVIVPCESEEHQKTVFDHLTSLGYSPRVVAV